MGNKFSNRKIEEAYGQVFDNLKYMVLEKNTYLYILDMKRIYVSANASCGINKPEIISPSILFSTNRSELLNIEYGYGNGFSRFDIKSDDMVDILRNNRYICMQNNYCGIINCTNLDSSKLLELLNLYEVFSDNIPYKKLTNTDNEKFKSHDSILVHLNKEKDGDTKIYFVNLEARTAIFNVINILKNNE